MSTTHSSWAQLFLLPARRHLHALLTPHELYHTLPANRYHHIGALAPTVPTTLRSVYTSSPPARSSARRKFTPASASPESDDSSSSSSVSSLIGTSPLCPPLAAWRSAIALKSSVAWSGPGLPSWRRGATVLGRLSQRVRRFLRREADAPSSTVGLPLLLVPR